MTPILDQVTSPSTTVSVSCRLLWRRTYQNNGAIHDEREATAEDVRRWLEVQTDEYRAECLAPFARISDAAWFDQEKARGLVMAERDSLKSRLSAAVEAKQKAERRLGVEGAQLRGDLTSARETIRTLEMIEQNHVRSLHGMQADIERLRDEGAAAEKDLASARETIRKLELQASGVGAAIDVLKQSTEAYAEDLAKAEETIRALTEETDARDRGTWVRCLHAGLDAILKAFPHMKADMARGVDHALRGTPYEPPRSEEGRPDSMVSDPTPPIRWQCSGCHWGFPGPWLQTCPCCGRKDYWSGSVHPNAPRWIPGALPVCGESIPAGHAQYFEAGTGKGTHVHCMSKARANATRLAPLTDRETAGCEFCRGPKRRCNEKCGECCYCQRPLSVAEKIAAIDDTETPDVQLPPGLFSAVARAINNEEETDVRREGFAAARPCTLCHGTGKRRVNHDRGEGQSVTYEDCSCGGAPPSIPPAAIAEIMRVAKWLDCDPDLYSIMCVAEEKLRLATEQMEVSAKWMEFIRYFSDGLDAHFRENPESQFAEVTCEEAAQLRSLLPKEKVSPDAE